MAAASSGDVPLFICTDAYTDSAAGIVSRLSKTNDFTDASVSSVFDVILTAFAMGRCERLSQCVFTSEASIIMDPPKDRLIFGKKHFPAGVNHVFCVKSDDARPEVSRGGLMLIMPERVSVAFKDGTISPDRRSDLDASIINWKVVDCEGAIARLDEYLARHQRLDPTDDASRAVINESSGSISPQRPGGSGAAALAAFRDTMASNISSTSNEADDSDASDEHVLN